MLIVNKQNQVRAAFALFMLLAMMATVVLCEDYVVPPIPLQKAPYAEWAHHHWVW